MFISCVPAIFEQFEDGCGGYVTPDQIGQEFLYEALGAGLEFSDLVQIDLPELDDEKFSDWDEFEYWCNDIEKGLMWDTIGDEKFDEIYETSALKDYFILKDNVFEKVLSILRSKESLSIMYVEIESENKTLFLIYGGEGDGWALGHYDSVLVVKSLDDLTPELGYYPQL